MKIRVPKISPLAGRLRAAGAHLSHATRADRTFLRLPRGWPEHTTRLYWYVLSEEGPRRGEAASVAELPDFVRRGRVQVWTPPSESVLLRAQLPTRSRARILQALPYALEEQLLEEPEKLHYAYTPNTDGSLAVAVTDRARMRLWLEALATAGIRPMGVCPAHLALPLQAGSWSAAFVDDELWVRNEPAHGFTCRAALDTPPAMLAAAVREAAATETGPKRLVIYGPPPELSLEAWSTALGIPVDSALGDFWVAAEAPPLNLLQGELAPTGHLRALSRPLLPAAIMLAVWLVGAVAIDVAEWLRLRHQHQVQTAEMRDIFLKSFPEAKTVVDPYAQMQKNLEGLQTRGGGPSDMLPLLARAAPTLQTQGRGRLHGLKYTERSLTLDLTLPDYQALDAIKKQLEAQSLEVEVVGANSRGTEVDGRLRLQARGAAKARRS